MTAIPTVCGRTQWAGGDLGNERDQRKRDVMAASHYAAIACERAIVHFHGSSSSILVLG
jgi:hypothetical protein